MALSEIAGILRIIFRILGVGSRGCALRDRRFGGVDCLISWALAGAALWASLWCWEVVSGSPNPYERMLPFFALLALVPVTVGLSLLALAFLVVGLIQVRSVRYLVLAVGAVSLLVGRFGGVDAVKSELTDPQGTRLQGAEWALEAGAATHDDCDRHSQSASFRSGCYEQLRRRANQAELRTGAAAQRERADRGAD